MFNDTINFTRDDIDKEMLLLSKQAGLSDKQIAAIISTTEDEVRNLRIKHNVAPWVKQVKHDTVFSDQLKLALRR